MVFRSRLSVLALGIFLAGLILSWRLVDLQILQGERYLQFSQSNVLRSSRITAPRGLILDREGRILVENQSAFFLTLDLSQVKRLDHTVTAAAFLLQKTRDEILALIDRQKKKSLTSRLVLGGPFSEAELARLRGKMSRIQTEGESAYDLNGLDLSLRYQRVYPWGAIGGHLLGYVREVSAKDLEIWEKREPGRVGPGDEVGVAGIEKAFDALLRGYDGWHRRIMDALGKEVDPTLWDLEGWSQEIAPQPGKNLRLTLDAALNQTAYEALGDHVGAVVALDPRNGEVLVMASKPSYDPKELSGVLTPEKWSRYRDDPNHILLHRPLQSAYPPGSTYKIVTAWAALAEGKVNFNERIVCKGSYAVGGRSWGCWNRRGHGAVNLTEALKGSCDVFFYQMGERLGPEKLAQYAHFFGLGKKTGLLFDSEREGLVPTSEWKQEHRHESWTRGDNLGNAIGQGFNLVTPMQAALMIARFANGGQAIEPHLIFSENTAYGLPEKASSDVKREKPSPSKGLSPALYKKLREALVEVVEGSGGTGKRAQVRGIRVGGKTGTAQVISLEKKGSIGLKTEDHAWFVAFAPAEAPRIAIAVMVEHGGGGGAVAAPIAQRVMAQFFDREGKGEHE